MIKKPPKIPAEFAIDPFSSMRPVWRKPCANNGGILQTCPYGAPGDLLWVRENWKTWGDRDALSPNQLPRDSEINYPATYDGWVSKCRPSIHMPRWASRLTLEITSVRVERLQDISESDARAEGWSPDANQHPYGWFRALWKSINGPNSWEANPWVWAIEFKTRPQNVDLLPAASRGQSGVMPEKEGDLA